MKPIDEILTPEEQEQLIGKDEPQFNYTDVGNGKRLIARHGRDIKFCHSWNKWLVWDGKRWKIDDTGGVERRAKETILDLYQQALNMPEDERRKMIDHARRSESSMRIKAMVSMAESEAPILAEELDQDPWLLNCNNGTVDLRTGELRPHKREDYITKLAPVNYEVADCPLFAGFLNRIMDGNDNLINYIQRAIGYSITGDTREQVIFMPYGSGANGKTTLIEILREALGDYAAHTPPETLLLKEGNGISNDIARLKGARMVTAAEVEEGKKLAESLVKQMTGGERMTARFMRAEFFEYKPTFKLWLATNHKPIIKGTDNAIWRRIHLIPFNVTIPEPERDKDLINKLKAELSGILYWIIDGCLIWQREGLGTPEEVRQATNMYKEEMDIMGGFINECCTVDPVAEIKAKELYQAYIEWCRDNGDKYPLSQKSFGMRLAERGFQKRKSTGGLYKYYGITLVADVPEETAHPF